MYEAVWYIAPVMLSILFDLLSDLSSKVAVCPPSLRHKKVLSHNR